MNIPAGITLSPQNGQLADRFHVEFVHHPVEKWSDEEGRKVFVDKEMAVITLPGGKNIHRRFVDEGLLDEWRSGKWRAGQMIKGPAPWAIHAYEQWRQGNEIPEHGTSLKNWPPVTPAFLKTCLAVNVRTVEDLASLNDDGLKRLGIGALNWKRQAHEWLEAAKNPGLQDAGRLAVLEQKLEALHETVSNQTDYIKTLESENRHLKTGGGHVPEQHVTLPSYPVVGGRGECYGDAEEARKEYSAEYERVFGKRPHHKMKPETMLQRIKEAQTQ